MTDERTRWNRVTELFAAALDRTPSDRARFLAEIALSEPDVAREIESLLAAEAAAGPRLDRPAFALAPDLLREPDLIGQTIGGYKILEEVGRGGMGVIYRATDTRLGRTVALKSLPLDLARDPVRRERLRREAVAAALVSHPNIATVYTLEEQGDQVFIVSEFVRGRTLRDELRAATLSFHAVARMGLDLARALEAAHAAGLIHRDLKPENIMRTDEGTVKVLDFGLVRFAGGAGDVHLTQTGAVLGTPGYMAPEQIQGQDVDFRADHFSLGVVLYEAAAGVHPFQSDTWAGLSAKIISVDPPPLVANTPAESNFAAVVHRCLRKRREERFASTTDLVGALERVLSHPSGQASGAMRPGVARFTPSWWWRAHQASITAFYAVIGVAVWRVKDWLPEPAAMLLFLLIVLAASLGGALRVHLLFTERFNRSALEHQLRRTLRLMRAADWAIAAVMLIVALALARGHTATAAGFAAASVIVAVTFLLIEPATLEAAFPEQRSGEERRSI
jgi:protein kinase-like protein